MNVPVTDSRPPAQTGADAYQYLQEYVAHGLHRSGTTGGNAVSGWVAEELRGMGYEVDSEAFAFEQFTPHTTRLHFVGDPVDKDVPVFPLYYSGRTGTEGITAELVNVGNGASLAIAGKNLTGKIVLASVALVERAETPTLAGVLQGAAAAGAAGVVVAIQGPQNLIVASNVNADTGLCGLPVLYVGKDDGAALAARSGQVASFVLDADEMPGTSYNVVATLPGSGDGILMIGTPVNGWFSTAAERGGGVGVLLTLARAIAEQYRDRVPPQTVMFIASGGHEVGYLGLGRYAEAHPDLVKRIYTYLHLGAAVGGTLYAETPLDGTVAALPLVDPSRTLYVSENPILLALADLNAVSSGMIPFEELPPVLLDPGEQAQMYDRGVPIMSISGTTLYFHTENDLPDTTSAAILDPVVQTYSAILRQLLALDPQLVRDANLAAGALAGSPPAPAGCVVPKSS